MFAELGASRQGRMPRWYIDKEQNENNNINNT